MEEKVTLRILELLQTMQEACQELYTGAELGDAPRVDLLCGDMALGLEQILQAAEETDAGGNQRLRPACQSILDSLRRVRAQFAADRETCLRKIEFELLPLLQEAYGTYYFFQYLANHPEQMPDYYANKRKLLFGNEYIGEALERGRFSYEVSIFVVAYNKLDYTKLCVESLLENLPKDLNYELILVNHGSSDGTKEYFESVHPDKQLDIAVNGGGFEAVCRIVEGEYILAVSNDVIVTPHAVENMLACIRSDSKIASVVPTTPNVSNLQTIPAEYSSLGELRDFALRNNCQDPFRWEQRVRLCNPIQMLRSSVHVAPGGLCAYGTFHTTDPVHAFSFPDDRLSLLLRRNGYKMMLAKDAYCHHFGSVTLKDEIRRQNEQTYYTKGRQKFQKAFGVDPWGCGFCFDTIFMDRMVEDDQGHIEVLGVSCGLGSNALKIKEQLKEYCHNTDCRLSFFTDDPRYVPDLQGIGDSVTNISSIGQLKDALHKRTFQYIVWEDAFLPRCETDMLLACFHKSLAPSGKLLLKQTGQNQKLIQQNGLNGKSLGNGWLLLRREDLKGCEKT